MKKQNINISIASMTYYIGFFIAIAGLFICTLRYSIINEVNNDVKAGYNVNVDGTVVDDTNNYKNINPFQYHITIDDTTRTVFLDSHKPLNFKKESVHE